MKKADFYRKKRLFVTKIVMVAILVFVCGFFLAKKINLANSDIGRHIKNGEIMLSGNGELRHKVLYENLYSYTNPKYKFVNHHWGAGVIFYLVWNKFGFVGLSFFYIAACLVGFLIAFFVAQKESSFWIAYLFAIIAAPLIGLRAEIRPEVATYVFAPTVFWILWYYTRNKISYGWLFLLPFIFLIWVNMNTYFVFGFYFIFLFWVESLFSYLKKIKRGVSVGRINSYYQVMFLTVAGFLSFIFSMLNPWGIRGVFYPFFINSQVEISVLELASPFLLKVTGELPLGMEVFFVLWITLLALTAILTFRFFRQKTSFPIIVWAITIIILSGSQARSVTFFALFAIPLLSMMSNIFLGGIIEVLNKRNSQIVEFVSSHKFRLGSFVLGFIGSVFLVSFFNYPFVLNSEGVRGVGLLEGSADAVMFLQKQDIEGEIFNDFDISSGLIFVFFPEKRIFVDHRPEAYPPRFFNDVLNVAMEDEDSWGRLKTQYNIKSIILTNNATYSKINLFVERRMQDPEWNLAYKDDFAYVLLKEDRPILSKSQQSHQ